MYTGHEHWELAESEARELSNLTGDLLHHNGIVISDRAGIIFETVMVLGSIYGSRVVMSVRAANAEAAGAPHPYPAPSPVAPSPPAAPIDPSKLNGLAEPAAAIGAGPLISADDETIPPMFRPPRPAH